MTGFELAGMDGVKVDDANQAFDEIQKHMVQDDVALILVSDDLSASFRDKLTELRTKKPMPLVYEIPAPGSKKQRVEYRAMLKSILGV